MRLAMQDIAEAVGGRCLNKVEAKAITNIVIDSRKITENSLFIPIKGDNFDGHHYIGTVFNKGAVATLSEIEEVIDERIATIYVKDTRKALLDLANYYRSLFDLPVIAVTGSVGKTTTKDMISAVLSGKFNVHKTQGNFNNEIGLPLTLFDLEKAHEVVVLEMGMNHFGEIHNLSCTANPNIGVITNIGTSHIENLGSREGILKAKLEILDGLDEGGTLVINGDDVLLAKLSDIGRPIITCGKSEKNTYYATDIVCESTWVKAVIHTPEDSYEVEVNAPGEHMIYNTLVAITVAERLGLTKDEILKGIASYKTGKMRMNIVACTNGITLIDDTYNASPDSMKAALKVLADFKTSGKKIAVLGDMLEMGSHARTLHSEVGAYAVQCGIDTLCSVGELAQHIE
ncbi:MAG: UDP-N-acetylmuramoyl-tripeptide--D-alanyl-D-alanine ligase, partial [Cellulosilyticaceae bacterium]